MSEGADSEDKTEAASPKRVQQAREAGNAPLSREVAGVAVLGAVSFLCSSHLPGAIQNSLRPLTRLLTECAALDLATATWLAGQALVTLALPFMLASALVGSLSVLGQTRFTLRTAALAPDFSRVNPMTGLMRLFGKHNLTEAAKGLIKIAVMGVLVWRGITEALPDLRQAMLWSNPVLAQRLGFHVLHIAIPVLGVQGGIAAIDMMRSQLSFSSSLRMTRQELVEENREGEGDPHIKQKLKQLRQQRSRKRMMQAVPMATVVVTNPTHYAVALVYERGSEGAPRIVAKGMDAVAARIRDAAERAGVPLVANPPLARALYPLPLESEVPAEYFRVVAELIAYVWRLKTPGVAKVVTGAAMRPAG